MAFNQADKIGNNQFVVIPKITCYNRINAVLDAFEHKKWSIKKSEIVLSPIYDTHANSIFIVI